MTEILEEKLLASEFTFGFELEAKVNIWKLPISKDKSYDNFVQLLLDRGVISNLDEVKDCETYGELYNYLRDCYDAAGYSEEDYEDDMDEIIKFEKIVDVATNQFDFGSYFEKDKNYVVSPSKGIAYDGSLGIGGFEYRTPVLKFTPDAIVECIKFLKNIKKRFIVDDKCGFHTHIAFNGIKSDDAMWIMLKLAMDYDEKNEITELAVYTDPASLEFEPISYSNSRYARTDYLEDIAEALNSSNFNKLSELLNNEKYRALRIHPQGTLEWRAPRGFLDEDNSDDYIKSFFLQLYQFINWMKKVLDEKTIQDCDLTRDNLIEMIKSNKNYQNNLFTDRYSSSDRKIYDRLVALDKAILNNVDKIPYHQFMKILSKVVNDSFHKKNNFLHDFLDYIQYEKADINMFSKVFAVSFPAYRVELIKHWELDNIPFEQIIKEYKKTSKIGESIDAYFSISIPALFSGTFNYMLEEDVINFINVLSNNKNNDSETYKSFIEGNIIRPLSSKGKLTKRIAKTIIDNNIMSFEELTDFVYHHCGGGKII